jgi:hypothetical protein
MDDGGGAMDQARGVMEGEAADRQANLAEAIPPAAEPLEPDRIAVLAEAVAATVEKLSGGQVELPPVSLPTEPVEAFPPDLGAQVLTLSGWLSTIPELEASYSIDPAMMSTNDGVTELGILVEELGRDPKVAKMMSKPVPSKPAPDEATEEEEPDLEELVPPKKGASNKE